MTATTVAARVRVPLVDPAWYGDHAAAFDVEAVEREVRDVLVSMAAPLLPGGHEPWIALGTGEVFAFVGDHAAAAAALDWRALLEAVDVEAIALRHEVERGEATRGEATCSRCAGALVWDGPGQDGEGWSHLSTGEGPRVRCPDGGLPVCEKSMVRAGAVRPGASLIGSDARGRHVHVVLAVDVLERGRVRLTFADRRPAVLPPDLGVLLAR